MSAQRWFEYAGIAGIGGLGVGFGLVVGAFVARALRKYMTDEGLGGRRNGNGRDA